MYLNFTGAQIYAEQAISAGNKRAK